MDPISTIELRTRTGVRAGEVTVRPTRTAPASGDGAMGERSTPLGRIREASEYRFAVSAGPDRVRSIEPEHLFDLDPEPTQRGEPATGRLRTRNNVGTVEVIVELESGQRLTGWLEICATKLDFETQYRWMLAGIAEDGAELLLRSYAPTTVMLDADTTSSGQGLYQQLAFLGAILQRPHTIEAFERVLRAPHSSYVDTAIDLPIGRGVPGSSAAVRSMIRPGARLPARSGLVIDTVPERVRDGRSQATIDNVPNRFARFVLDHWAAVLDRASMVLVDDTADHRRGRREVAGLIDLVEGWRTDRRLRDVGPLDAIPSGNQVILRRPGYREIYQAFLESQAAAMLRWDGAEEVHRAGQQDIAQLYEYWCYLELRRLVERLCDFSDSSPLVELTDNGLHLRLRRGRQRVVSGFLSHAGRHIDVELWFNRSFSREGESWSMQMRPDCSLRFQAQTSDSGGVETWVHFDAKYRVQSANDLFVDDDAPVRANRDDMLKMHAYRDAIRSSAGSYVLFPGDEGKEMRKHEEVLPGLGAFPFTPGSNGHATPETSDVLLDFLHELIDHIASPASNRERAAWWSRRAHHDVPVRSGAGFVATDRPPADTTLLIGYYRSLEHLAWIEEHRLYNMRFGGSRRGGVTRTGDEASAELLLLWSHEHGQTRIWRMANRLELLDAVDLQDLGYPRQPEGRYLCRPLIEILDVAWTIDQIAIGEITDGRATGGRSTGGPVVVTWADLLDSVEQQQPR